MSRKELARCPWAGIADPLYARYHDEEWGVPKTDDRALFEKLVLEGFQSGLSWITILRKRENFRKAFHGFDAQRIARYGAKDIARLMARPRHRAQPPQDRGDHRQRARAAEAAAAHLASPPICGGSSAAGRRSTATAPSRPYRPRRPTSKAISKALKAEGFRFVGPTTVYAFMQATGMVNDHLVGCHRYEPCAALQRRFKLPRPQENAPAHDGQAVHRCKCTAGLAAHAVGPAPRPARSRARDIEIEDIAHGLARVARWNGQTVGDHAFSVAQHALLVEEIAGAMQAGPEPRAGASPRCCTMRPST